ncbi:helix-turn-helix domain-containing protein [Schaalia georgiae]|uniref:helix-turn-helix domain-containing protein n=1 Tax=Schaalia georgiae TaxID=52768 RepID=UPI000586E6AC|nr:helix-turn-helix domain-containing protein [Schaalia georgiae]
MAREAKALTEADQVVIGLIKELFDASGLSGRAIADELAMSRKRFQTILNGGTPAPTIGEAIMIASALGAPAPDFLSEAERRIAAGADRSEVWAAPASAAPAPKPAASASSTGYRTRWAGVRALPRLGPTPEEQERMAARMADPHSRGGLPDDWGEEPQV